MGKLATNIKQLREVKKLSQEQLAEKLDITRSRLGAYEEDRNEPPIAILIRLSDFFHISVDALIKGDLKKTDPDSLMKAGKNRTLFPIMVDTSNNDMIEMISAKASAGYLNGYSDPEYVEHLPLMKLPFVPTGKHRAFPIKGDSMPPLKDGSFVVAKYIESVDELKDGRTYVLLTKSEGIVYKRLYRNAKTFTIELHSDNKSYQPYTVNKKDILEIWEYTCSINVGNYTTEELNPDSIMKMLKSMQVEIKSIKGKN